VSEFFWALLALSPVLAYIAWVKKETMQMTWLVVLAAMLILTPIMWMFPSLR
jgi:hypothetical protein